MSPSLDNKRDYGFGTGEQLCPISNTCLFKTPVSLGNSSPGSSGGGATPSAVGAGAANPSILATALTLVPLSLTPIAVFPPYNTPRQIPAISVIFSEDPDTRYKKFLLKENK